MRFVWAVAAFVLATVLIGAGIAQRTVFQGPKTSSIELSVEKDAPYLLIDGSVLNSLSGTQTVRAYADGDIFAAYGRTSDMRAWLADTSFNVVTLGDEGEPRTTLITPTSGSTGTSDGASGATTPDDAPSTGDASGGSTDTTPAAAPTRSPIGSDLWLDEYQQSDVLIAPLELSSDMSVLIATDGTAPAPSDVTVSWPISNSTPWAGPLIAAGAVLMAVGVFLYFLGIRHARRSRGPRRKGLPLPQTEPIDIAVEEADKGVISSSPSPRRLERGRRALIAVPALGLSAVLFAGCSADSWPSFGPSATPSPTASVIVPEGQQSPAVTKVQAERILARIGATVAKADEGLDKDLAATRLEGAALDARSTNYVLRGAIADYAALPAILTDPLEIILPQAFDAWPRSVMMVVDDKESKTSSIMVMTQADPWSNYKVSYIASLEASTEMPDLAPAYIGAPKVQPDSPFLIMAPQDVAAAYADILNKGDQSEFYDLFDAETDEFRTSIAADQADRLAEFNQTAQSQTGTLTFASTPGVHDPLALATLESGAIVAVNLNETDTAKPTSSDAVITLGNNLTVQTLAGATQSAGGFTTTFSDQLFFYVPGQGSTEKIRLLGYGSDILDAQVIK